MVVGLFVCLVGCGVGDNNQKQSLSTNSRIDLGETKTSIIRPASQYQPSKPKVADKFSYPAPKISDISSSEARLITDTKMLPHTDDTKYLEEVLIHWLSERPVERMCVAYTDLDSARTSYTGEDIAFSGNRGGTLPIEPYGNWVRMSPSEADKVSRRVCNAMPFVKIVPDEIRYSKEGQDYASVGCMNGISRAGLIAHPYPEGFRSFLAFRETDGSINILRGHRRYTDDYAIEHRIMDRNKRQHLFCGEEEPKQ